MKIKVEVCEICRQEKCNGNVYYYKTGPSDGRFFCESSEGFKWIDGKPFFHLVIGHGITEDISLTRCGDE